MKHFNELTAAEAERPAILAEECGEIVQVIGKILRHGYKSSHPMDSGGTTNAELLEKEIGDFEAIMGLMVIAKDINEDFIVVATKDKINKLPNWTHHQ